MLIDNGEIAIYQYSTQEEKKKIKLDNWSETVLLTFFFPQRKVIQYETNFIHTVAIQESSGKCTVAAVGFSRLPYASRLSGSFVSQPPQILLRIFYDIPCCGGQFLAQSYTHTRQSTPVDIAHFAPGFYSTPGLVFDVFLEIIFLENSPFLVSLSTQHAVQVGTQYRLVLCGAPPSPASVVVL